jgi:uncharacterized protein (TIGR00251 family)
LIKYSENQDGVSFQVQVVPRASRSEVVGEHDSALRVRLAAPPVDGAANDELIRLLSRALGLSKGDIEIRSGHASKRKLVTVRGLSYQALAELLNL